MAYTRQLYLVYSAYTRKIFSLPIYVTNRCNARCLTCNIWKKRPKEDLNVDIIEEILGSKVIHGWTEFLLTGGEFFLHPKYREILSLFSNRDYCLLSNGILADLLIEAIQEFDVKKLHLSLDGTPETNKMIRGVDCYSNIQKIIDELQNEDVSISVEYTVSPWNSREDFLHVRDFCSKNNVNFTAGYYNEVEYFDTTRKPGHFYHVNDLIHHPYFDLYDPWVSGYLNIPCYSILVRPSVMPNGDVKLCEAKEIKLGNLYEQRLEDIWKSKKTIDLQKRYISCNGCWLNCQRIIDIHMVSLLKSFIPTPLLEKLFGAYDWRKLRSIRYIVASARAVR